MTNLAREPEFDKMSSEELECHISYVNMTQNQTLKKDKKKWTMMGFKEVIDKHEEMNLLTAEGEGEKKKQAARQMKSQSRESSRDSSRKSGCNRCGKEGHWRRECKEKELSCNYCNTKTHNTEAFSFKKRGTKPNPPRSRSRQGRPREKTPGGRNYGKDKAKKVTSQEVRDRERDLKIAKANYAHSRQEDNKEEEEFSDDFLSDEEDKIRIKVKSRRIRIRRMETDSNDTPRLYLKARKKLQSRKGHSFDSTWVPDTGATMSVGPLKVIKKWGFKINTQEAKLYKLSNASDHLMDIVGTCVIYTRHPNANRSIRIKVLVTRDLPGSSS